MRGGIRNWRVRMRGRLPERIFLAERNIEVTNIRFVVYDQTFAISGITSVRSFRRSRSKIGPLACLAFGLLGIFVAVDSELNSVLYASIVLTLIGVLWWIARRTRYSVVWRSASGEVEELSSTNKSLIKKVFRALNLAIISRG